MGLDLADNPRHTGVLGFLPPDVWTALLQAAGFARNEHTFDVATTDPLSQAWGRAVRPTCLDQLQAEPLLACFTAAYWDNVAHRLPTMPVETRRFFYRLNRSGAAPDSYDPTGQAQAGLGYLWDGYLTQGRDQLLGLGKPVAVAPQLAPGFATADLAIGRALVEIKSHLEPASLLGIALDQALTYALLDRQNRLDIAQVAMYLGWQAILLSVSLTDLLRLSTRGPTPQLNTLRNDLWHTLRDEIAQAQCNHSSRH